MLGLIFSLDYEIYGTGKGGFSNLMIAPTSRLLDLFDKHKAKLTIMAEVAEIMALKRSGSFSPIVERIENQLVRAIERGHDVQLHLHPAWFNARYDGRRWILDFDEYALVGLPYERIRLLIQQGKEYLENLLHDAEHRSDYKCVAFRAGNWLMQPSRDIIEALEKNAIEFDTSVYKWGFGRVGQYTVDYRGAHSNIFSWTVDKEDINKECLGRRGLKEVPILTQQVFVTSMLTWKRLNLQWKLRRDSKDDVKGSNHSLGGGKKTGSLKLMHAKKFDFCRLSFREMKNFLAYAEDRAKSVEAMVPIVAIGHSTEFCDDGCIEDFLSYLNTLGTERIAWTTFNELCANKVLSN